MAQTWAYRNFNVLGISFNHTYSSHDWCFSRNARRYQNRSIAFHFCYIYNISSSILFSSWLGVLKGVAKAGNITFANFALPVLTIVAYDIGYIARMTRASMVEVMGSQYIRTARLKGMPFMAVVLKHALRNALIAPFTVIMLQFPWLLTGVVIVEKLFNYKGFGFLLVSAADQNDIDVTLACGVVAVVLVLTTQLISDIGYIFLNPRIRFS